VTEPNPSSSAARPVWMLLGPGLAAVLAACQFGFLLGPPREALQRSLGMSLAMAAAVVLLQLVAAAMGFAAGYLLGRRAPASVVATATVLMLLGAVVAGLANMSALLMVAATLIGFGGGTALGAAAALTGQLGERRGQALAGLGALAFAGLVLGLLTSWFFTIVMGWRVAYLATIPFALLALAATGVAGLVALTRRS